MKQLTLLFLFCIILLNMVGCNQPAQTNSPDEKNIQMLKDFYKRYMTELAIDTNMRRMEKRLDSIKKIYCSERLIKRIATDSDLDADPLINAQDADTTWLKTLVIKKEINKPNQYLVTYSDGYSPADTIRLTVEKDKIDSVW